jgi:hypothetical protein
MQHVIFSTLAAECVCNTASQAQAQTSILIGTPLQDSAAVSTSAGV